MMIFRVHFILLAWLVSVPPLVGFILRDGQLGCNRIEVNSDCSGEWWQFTRPGGGDP
jgi:hypothetical protein